MRHPQIQFFDFNGALETYVCQFADRTDPRVTARFTAMSLAELKIAAVSYIEYTHHSHHGTPNVEYRQQLDRVDSLARNLSEKLPASA